MHAFALCESGEYPRSKKACASLLATNPNDVDVLGRLGTIAVRTGDSLQERLIDQRLTRWREPYAFGRPAYWRAHLAALTGRYSDAVSLLHSALKEGYRPIDLDIVTLQIRISCRSRTTRHFGSSYVRTTVRPSCRNHRRWYR